MSVVRPAVVASVVVVVAGALASLNTVDAGPAPAPLVLHRCGQVSAITGDAEFIYGIVARTKLMRFARGAAKEETLASVAEVVDLTTDETSVFWIERAADGWVGLERISKAGGASVRIAALDSPSEMTLHADTIYVRTGSRIVGIAKAGGAPAVIIDKLKSSHGPLVADDHHLYWVDGDALWRAPLAGGARERLADYSGDTRLLGDADHVYWGQAGTIRALALRAGATPSVLARTKAEVAAIAQDATHIYWVAQNQQSADDDVLRVAKRGGKSEPVAVGELGRSAGPMNELVVADAGVTIASLDGRLITYPKRPAAKAKRPALPADRCE